MTMTEQQKLPDPIGVKDNEFAWVIMELSGHRKIAGRYFDLGTTRRVDIPLGMHEDFLRTVEVGEKFIYMTHYVDEATARAEAARMDIPLPIAFSVEVEMQRRVQKLASGGVVIDDEEHDPDDWQDEDYPHG